MAEAAQSGATSDTARAYGVQFFAYAPDMADRIEAWAEERGVRVLKVVPVYLEAPRAR